ncbi:hypothetical protein HN695_06515 [Candidatus Woesearchaeota archaeon]|jgi:hypothetical protein|nr:hypothetical protein [Candidatus Woesearchaeota archaeon]MBT5272837.1 hypothetical protein [Candidatus Woesearchaeota archaeon]MBT6040449.1 hypothetical protein [Candidatus Woesearchaeota archaeon]MBT6336456.1 hypothetical protein [Candidatus Woesearchaeota archaeon]MBT7927960.1 hypothetical protein [Candidatus Woesearchaeota archaeon]
MWGYQDIRDFSIIALASIFMMGAAPNIKTDQRFIDAMQNEINVAVVKPLLDIQSSVNEVVNCMRLTASLMPSVYKELVVDSKTFFSIHEDNLESLCDWKKESVCYNGTDFFVYAGKKDSLANDLVYELAKVYYDSLPVKQKKTLEKKLKTYLVSDKEAKQFKKWKENETGPGFWLLSPEAADSVEELVLSYVADIYGNNGDKTVDRLSRGYKGNVVRILDIMEEFGFFGTMDESLKLLNGLYRRGNVG